MNKKKLFLIFTTLLFLGASVMWYMMSNNITIDALSGATPKAMERNVPQGLELKIEGRVIQKYYLNSRSLQLLAKTRIRTIEKSPEGEILGAYIYSGIPVIYIMEGVAPIKHDSDAFDRPLDMMVIFSSSKGQTSTFSYGELTMVNDSLPITIAYHREPILPSKNPETYTKNKYKENIKGLRLICPREPDTSRYLDDVIGITLEIIDAPDHLLPVMQKGHKCSSPSISCINGDEVKPAIYDQVETLQNNHWLRIGHGKGIKGTHPFSVSGYSLISFLKKNFQNCNERNFFLFVGCDGYRALFSGYEIFSTEVGKSFLIFNTLNGEILESGNAIGAMGDFFVDRDVWGLSHIACINMENERKP